jgi:LCP family protein required for cell wall assembly
MSAALPPELSPRSTSAAPPSSGRGGRVLGWLATALAVAVLVTSVGGWGLLTYFDGKIQRLPGLGSLLTGSSDGPLNLLVVGADSREGLTAAQRRRLSISANAGIGERSDTMMLVHISADRRDVTVVSLPRDSYVTIPAYTDDQGQRRPAQRNKLNAAYAFGGAPLLIETVHELTGVEINHYVEVGFSGVVNMVDALHGVDVCVPNAVDDSRHSGLVLPAGTSHVGGAMGLAFVRARYIDPTADLGRMQRQQQFLAAMFQRATSLGVLLDPGQLSGFLDAALSSVKVDDSLTRDAMLDLASGLQSLKPKNLRFLTVPLANPNGYVDGVGSVVLWDKAKAREVFASLQSDQPLVKPSKGTKVSVAPSRIRVQVLNGSSVAGLAGTASNDLAALGYVIAAPAGNADRTDVTTTVIQYDPTWSESVKTLQAAFPGAEVQAVEGMGGTFKVLVGTGYAAPVKVRVVTAPPKIDSHTAADAVCG